MKKIKNSMILAMILTVCCLLLSGMIFYSYLAAYSYRIEDSSQISRYPGDVNADFKIGWEDVSAMQALYLNGAAYSQLDLECADLNKDGEINNQDTAILLQYLSGHDQWTLQGLEAYCRSQE